MSNIPYTSIKAILYDLSDLIPSRYWNEDSLLEWANKGLRRIGTAAKYQTALQLIPIIEHKAILPSDVKYLIQIAYKTDATASDVEAVQHIMNLDDVKWSPAITHMEDPMGLATKAAEASTLFSRTAWRPLRLSSNVFSKSIHCNPTMFLNLKTDLNCSTCSHEYSVDIDMTITTSLKDGMLMVSYLRFPVDEEGDTLIPDNEELKDAIMHYCLWRYWMKKTLIGEAGAQQERDYHKTQFGLMKAKAQAILDSPDIAQLENIKANIDRLLPRDNQYSSFFSKLNNREKLTY